MQDRAHFVLAGDCYHSNGLPSSELGHMTGLFPRCLLGFIDSQAQWGSLCTGLSLSLSLCLCLCLFSVYLQPQRKTFLVGGMRRIMVCFLIGFLD